MANEKPENKDLGNLAVTHSFLKNPNNNTKKQTENKNAGGKNAGGKKPSSQPQKSTTQKNQQGNKAGNKAANAKTAKPNAKKPAQNSNKPAAKKNNAQQNNQQQKVAKKGGEQKQNRSKGGKGKKSNSPEIKVIPLGGLGEIGKNITLFECNNDMMILDCGMAFPESDMLGVDIVIPDFTYVEKNIDKIKGLVITHGHEDHIGAIPYLLKKVNLPIYASPLAIGLIKGKLREHGLLGKANLNEVRPGQILKFGCLSVEMIHVNHSIPDAMGVAIKSPAGTIVHTGDFKIDYTPIEGGVTDLARLAELGREGILCLMSDSTNAERPGSTPSESVVGKSFDGLFTSAEGRRIIIASFSSNIHRIQQIITVAERFGRRVAVSGRSMENVVAVAMELGYLSVPKGLLVDIDNVGSISPENLVIITTGSQGEPMSALSRMAAGDHRKVAVTRNDFIIISATPIPGNEKHVTKVVNDLLKLGAEVVYEAMYEVHVSGHACQQELKTVLAVTKPKYFIPVHGEYKHFIKHAKLASEMGVAESNIHIAEIGQIISISADKMGVTGTAESGLTFVDGLGVGDVGAIVLRDRQHLAQDGLIIAVMTMESTTGTLIAGPDIVSRGFVYVRESEQLIADSKQVVKNIVDVCIESNIRDWATIKSNVRDALSGYIFKKTKRSPMILPIITEI